MSGLIPFLDSSPTSFHAVRNLTVLSQATPFKGKIEINKTYSIQNEGSLLLFRTPSKRLQSAVICAAHTDSPALKLKPQPEVVRDNLFLLASEVYGSPILSSWLNRDLKIAGRILFKGKKGELVEKLVDLEETTFTLPQLAPHLGSDETINRQEHLKAIAGLYDKKIEGHLLETLLKVKEIIAHDLFLVPQEKARRLGFHDPLIASYRLDNLASCHAILEAFTQASPSALAIAVFWDHEEIGSETSQGALSTFFLDAFEQIALALGLDRKAFLDLKKESKTYSIDLAHASHPNYPEKNEPEHSPLLGSGPAVKWSASFRYATTANSAAALPPDLQRFVIRSDLKGGSTLGPLHAARTGIATADLGIPQLSMHSIRELIAEKDHGEMIRLLKKLYESHTA